MMYLQQSIGIEFREHTLRLVHLGKTITGIKLLNYLHTPLPAGDVSIPGYREAVAALLKEFIQQHKLKFDEVVIGLPPHEIALRQLELPAVEPEELSQMLEYEIERHLPFASHEVYFDFLVTDKKEQTRTLLLLAARRDRVDQYLELLADTGLKCVAVDITPLAILNLLEINGLIDNDSTPKKHLLVEIGAETIELSLIKSAQLVMTRSLPRSELGFLSPPESADSQSENPAEAPNFNPPDQDPSEQDAKDQNPPDQDPGDQAAELVQGIAREIDCWQKSLAYNTEQPLAEHIFVLSGGERGEVICHQLEEQTHIKASIPDNWPIIKSRIDNGPQIIELGASLGLALRGVTDYPKAINLLPPLQRPLPKRGRVMVTMALMALVAILLVANLISFFLKDRLALAKVKEQTELLEPRLAAINKLENQYRDLQLKVNTLRRVKPRTITTLDILKELTLTIPKDAWLEKMSIEDNTVEISGRASSASSLISLLEESSLFEDVKFTSAITSREGKKEKFKIKMNLEGQNNQGTY
jgi:type IV pilus assembly protein PilM